MTYYAVIDTNVLVSALLSKHSDSATVLVVEKIFDGKIAVLYSREVLAEYREVLKRPRFKFDPRIVDVLIAAVERNGISIEPGETGAIPGYERPAVLRSGHGEMRRRGVSCNGKYKALSRRSAYRYSQRIFGYYIGISQA